VTQEDRQDAAVRLAEQLVRQGFYIASWPDALLLTPDGASEVGAEHIVIRPLEQLTPEQRAAVEEYRVELIAGVKACHGDVLAWLADDL
jgi:hypothetical protein